MAMLLIRMKNATDSARTWVGLQEIQPGDYYELQSSDKEVWENDEGVLYSIEHGELVVNDGYNDLIPEDGLLRLQAETEAQKILFSHADFKAREVRAAVNEASTRCTGLIGFAHSATFSKSGVLLTDGNLMRVGTASAKYYPLPLSSVIRAVSFVAKEWSRPDFDIQVCGRKNGKTTVLEQICVRGHWYGYITLVSDRTIYSGTLISVSVKRAGRDPEDLCVDVMLQAVCDLTGNFYGGY